LHCNIWIRSTDESVIQVTRHRCRRSTPGDDTRRFGPEATNGQMLT
jgi:hypothetical protein